ncbi:MAG: ribosomal-protein-alanine N-acetyltransferase [Desulfobulbaceae bacterium]|nr:MAG: ribosomal-protein-alanine N-acetyltransferase [Desulfobulbaceae bacterium]
MIPADLDEVLRLEAENPSPWSREDIEREIGRYDRILYVTVDETLGVIVGWCCCRFLDDQAELLKIAVLGSMRRRGVASGLLTLLLEYLAGRGVQALYLEVRSRNFPALRFYRKHGFAEVGRRRRYYFSPDDDAIVLERDFAQ